MIEAIIKNEDNSFEYLFRNNDNFICYHADNNGFSLSNELYINKVRSLLRKNDDCEFLTKFKEYDVYYDYKTKLKHFLLNGKEDYEMFFYHNGVDACLYDNDSKDNKNKKLKGITKTFIILGLSITTMLSGLEILVNNTKIQPQVYLSHSVSDVISMYKNEPLTYEDAVASINSSSLPDEFKQVISNEQFLKFIFSFYKGTSLEYSAFLKFNDLKIEIDKGFETEPNSVRGYYSAINPNVINLRSTAEKDVCTFVHEFIHLLQAENSLGKYQYLEEAMAELMASELLEEPVSAYFTAVDNLKLLINIVGPEPILEMNFSGDDTKLDGILKSNLSNKDYLTLKHHLAKTGYEINTEKEFQFEIRDIFYKLYKNMYGKEITEDTNIIDVSDEFLTEDSYCKDGRKFVLPYKMEDKEQISISYPDKEALAKRGLLERKTCYKELIKVNNPTYDMYIYDLNMEWKETYNSNGLIHGKIIDDGTRVYYRHLETPIREDKYEFFSFRQLPGKTYDMKEAIEKGFITGYNVLYSENKTNDNQTKYVYYVENSNNVKLADKSCYIEIDGLTTRFEDQYQSLIARINGESYQK